MAPRLNPFTASPAAMQPWIELGKQFKPTASSRC